ncbi:hypothetical protein, partial [Mesorhizobium sp. WSM4989]|uniref:hypothetical protein n=1 Tax=Mesorhizobium sp. WSM4989 TaxID=3038541 RepID=UPI002417149B
GVDDATQMLGEDMIKLIKKKSLSANYCKGKYSQKLKKYLRFFGRYLGVAVNLALVFRNSSYFL